MTTPAAATSIRHEIVVQAPIARAFSVFTEGFGSFKLPEVVRRQARGEMPANCARLKQQLEARASPAAAPGEPSRA